MSKLHHAFNPFVILLLTAPTVAADQTAPATSPATPTKTDAWTEGCHQGRAMLNLTERLKKPAGEK